MADDGAWKIGERKRVRAAIANGIRRLDSTTFKALASACELTTTQMRQLISVPSTLAEIDLYGFADNLLKLCDESKEPELFDSCVMAVDLSFDEMDVRDGFMEYFVPAQEVAKVSKVFERLLAAPGSDRLVEEVLSLLREPDSPFPWSRRNLLAILTRRRRLTLMSLSWVWACLPRAMGSSGLSILGPDVYGDFEDVALYIGEATSRGDRRTERAKLQRQKRAADHRAAEDSPRRRVQVARAAVRRARVAPAGQIVPSEAWRTLREDPRREEWIERLMGTFNPKVDHNVKARAAQERVSVFELKRQVLHISLALAFDRALAPWIQRADSTKQPIIPGCDLSSDALRDWLDREARRAGRADLRGADDGRSPRDLAFEAAIREALWGPRSRRPGVRVVTDEDEFAPDEDEDEIAERHQAARDEMAALLNAALPADREVLKLWLMGIREPAEIARRLGRKPNAVYQSKSRIEQLPRPDIRNARKSAP